MTVGQVIAKLGVDPKEYEKGLRKAETQANKAGSKIGAIFKNAFSVTLGVGMFEALKKGFKSTVGTAISFNSMLQTAQIGFATMLGSAEKAQKFLEDMADFAVRTPFEYPELLEAAKRMLAYGFAAEEVLPTLRAVGDASAALGSGSVGIDRITLALGQIRAKGKLSAEEMRQLTEAGIPAWHMLAEAMGTTVPELQDMVSKGLVPGAKAVEMLTKGMTKRFGGMMESMGDTWRGVTSSIKSIWRMTISEMTSGLFSSINTWLKGVRDWLSGFYNTFKQFGLQAALLKYFGAEFATMANVVIWAARTVFNALGWVYGILRQNWGMVSVLATAFLTYATVSKIAAGATAAFRAISLALKGELASQIPILGWISTAVGIYKTQMALASMQGVVMTGVLAKLKVALYSLWTALGPIGWIILAITAIVAGGMALWNKYAQSVQEAFEASMAEKMKAQQEKLKQSMKGATGATEEQTDALNEASKAAAQNLQSFDEVHQLQEDMADVAGLDMPSLDPFELDDFDLPEIDFSEMLEQPKATFAGFMQWIGDGLKSAWDWVKKTAVSAWEGIKNAWKTASGWLNDNVIKPVGKFFSDLWRDIKRLASDAWSGIVGIWQVVSGWFYVNVIQPVAKFFASLWHGIKEAASNAWNSIVEAWNGATSWFDTNIIQPIAQFFVGLWEGIKEVWNKVAGWFDSHVIQPIVNAFNGLKTKIIGIWDGIWGGIKSVVNSIIGGINTLIKGLNTLHFDIPDWVPLIGGKSFGISIPLIPKLATGTNYVPQDMFAYLHEGEAVVPKKYNPAAGGGSDAGELERAVYRGMISALRIAQASTQQDNRELVFKLDSTPFARVMLSALIREGQRQGFDIVLRPQGV
jgi:tape measure domain-containing protein